MCTRMDALSQMATAPPRASLADVPTLCPVPEDPAARPVSRRVLLGGALAAGLTGLTGLTGCSPDGSEAGQGDAYCVTRDTLERRSSLGDPPPVYEPSDPPPA